MLYRAAMASAFTASAVAVVAGFLGLVSVVVVCFAVVGAAAIVAVHGAVRMLLATLRAQAARLERAEDKVVALSMAVEGLRQSAVDAGREIDSLGQSLLPQVIEAIAAVRRDLDDRHQDVMVHHGAVVGAMESVHGAVGDITAEAKRIDRGIQAVSVKIDEAAARSNRLRSTMLEGFRATRVNIEYAPQAADQYRTMRKLLAPEALAMPLSGGWALTAGALTETVALVSASPRPLRVLELGSGVSTIWTSLAMRRRGGGEVLSLEHNHDFLQESAASVESFGAPEHVRLIHAPLERIEIEEEEFDWYELSGLPDDMTFDVLVIDGPPGQAGKLTRYPALHRLAPRLARGALILLDDTIRIEERRTLDRWLAEFTELSVERRLEKATLLRWSPAASA